MSAPTINVALVGAGLVGGEVLSQLLTVSSLRAGHHVVHVQNSRKALQIKDISAGTSLNLDAGSWSNQLRASDAPALAPEELAKHLADLSAKTGRHTAVIDNTSSDVIAAAYPTFLQAGLSVVTPNKKAYSAPLDLYARIVALTTPSPDTPRPPLAYLESTVGAGLPIVGTLTDLVRTGDQIKRIEGVLSGTLSYIFNTYSPASAPSTPAGSFSDVVRVAKEQGYTEPHPADDLSGSDVARKLCILSRLIPQLSDALPEGFSSVDIRSLTPAALEKEDIKDPEQYLTRLKDFDAEFESLKSGAEKEGKVLRYVGVIDVEKREIKASLESYPNTHPFATSLSGSDNIISFTTSRYSARPLLVQGAGAGAAVTAMGVVADLERVRERRG